MSNKKIGTFTKTASFCRSGITRLDVFLRSSLSKGWEITLLRRLWKHVGEQVLGLRPSGCTPLNDEPLSID